MFLVAVHPLCGALLGYVNGFHVRCVARHGHVGPHIDRSGGWWS